jgi:hypothetical protein
MSAEKHAPGHQAPHFSNGSFDSIPVFGGLRRNRRAKSAVPAEGKIEPKYMEAGRGERICHRQKQRTL